MSVPQTLYITGISRPATENPISQRHRVLFLAFLVDAKTGTILEVDVKTALAAVMKSAGTIRMTAARGGSLKAETNNMRIASPDQVEARYWGHSRKSILVAIKQAHTKWINWSSGHRSPLS